MHCIWIEITWHKFTNNGLIHFTKAGKTIIRNSMVSFSKFGEVFGKLILRHISENHRQKTFLRGFLIFLIQKIILLDQNFVCKWLFNNSDCLKGQVFLNSNPWVCDCTTMPFVSWINEHPFFEDHYDSDKHSYVQMGKCQYPPRLR